ncbi:MAG TPA: septum site-determining protein MinC [Pseudogracilibacillus sp.]|nr:septum site-determining protein MinC [Pseudogracilibacillus sp.]
MKESQSEQRVIIKGTKEGLIFYLDDECSFQTLVKAIQTTLTASDQHLHKDEQASVILNLGYRYLHDEQRETLKQIIEHDQQFIIDKYESEVIGKKEAEQWLEKSEVKRITQIVRSGQVVEVTGDLLLVGDVNPGGQVKATGSIYVLGHLNGIAHAGVYGDEKAVIAASYMNPTQLRIAKYISRAPDYEASGVYMECGYLDKSNEKIVIDRLQVLPYILKQERAIERRMTNG